METPTYLKLLPKIHCVLQVEEAVKLPGLLYVLPTVPNPMNLMLYSSCKIPELISPP